MNLKTLCQSMSLLFPLALPMAVQAVTPPPTIVQSSGLSGPSAPITLTLASAPTPGNTIYAFVWFGIYGDRNFNPPDSSWSCTLGSGGSVHINTCSHIAVSGDGTSYTFTPTSTDGPGVGGVIAEVAGTVSAQIAYSYAGSSLGRVTVTSSPSLTPSVLGMLPLAFTAGGDTSSINQAGWSPLLPNSGMFVSTPTTDTTTPISTTFNYVNNNEANSLQGLILLAPGVFASAPSASPAAGSYPTAQLVALSDSTPGAVVHYTLDGSTPGCSSPAYSTPISIPTTTTLSSMACAPGYANSAIRMATYVVAGGTLAGVSLGPLADLHGYVPFAGDLFHQDISAVPVDANSANTIANIGASHLHHDWSSVNGGNYGIPYIVVDSTVTPLVPFVNQLYSDESDLTLYPIPTGLPIESNPPTCSITGDNHAIILDKATGVDYEFYRAQYCPGNTPIWQAANGVLWDMTTIEKRPYTYTSVDAAGLSVFEGLVRYDEIVAGAINHAIRFTTTFTRCDHYDYGDGIGAFVAPATHAACNNSGTLNITGMRIRLKASFDISGFSPTNQIILTAMKKYGMILADNGSSLYFQGTPDARWNDNDLSALDTVGNTNFEVIQMPPVYSNDSYPTGAAPTVNAFTAASATITAGQSTALVAAVNGASYTYVDVAGFMRNSSMTVAPTQTTTYTLTSRNAFGTTSMATTVTVLPASYKDPSLALAAVTTKSVADPSFPVSATSLSTGAITYSVVSGPASISGNTVVLSGAGMVVIEASEAPSGIYKAATATVSFEVNGIAPGLAMSAIADQSYGAAPFAVSAQSNSSAAISYTVVSGPATLAGSTVSLTGIGTVTLQASQVASGRYAAATAQVSFGVKAVAPTLAFVPIPTLTYSTVPFTVSSTSNSAGGDSYSVVSGPASIQGNTLTLTGAGKIVLMVSQAAAGDYTAATATTTFKVLPVIPQLAFEAIAPQTYGAAPLALSATSASPGAVTYYVAGGPATLYENTLSLNGAGTVTVLASQAATGNYAAAVAVATIPVKMQTPTVYLELSAAETTNVSAVTFEMDVAVTGRAYPTGSLEILDGTNVVGVYPLKSTSGGDMRGVMPGSLGVGTHHLSAVYTGDSNYTSAGSAVTLFTVDVKMAKAK